jgi:heme/copper-type cytochrome/quinol oxidase subunit 2
MEIRTEPMTIENIQSLEQVLARNYKRLWKILMWSGIILGVTLFIPAQILSLFKRRVNSGNVTGQLFFELGPLNVLIYIIIPVLIIIVLVYIYVLHIPKIKKDIKHKVKEIGTIKVKEIKELSEQDKKDVLGTADYIIKFEQNPFKIDETYFLKSEQPELFQAEEYIVEVSEIAKFEFERKIIKTLPNNAYNGK